MTAGVQEESWWPSLYTTWLEFMLQLVASMRSYALERKSRVVGVEVGSDVSGKILEIIFFSLTNVLLASGRLQTGESSKRKMEYLSDSQNNIKRGRWNLKDKQIQLRLAKFPGYFTKMLMMKYCQLISAGERKQWW